MISLSKAIPPEPCERNHFLQIHVEILLRSFKQWTDKDLLEMEYDLSEAARILFHAPFAVLSHNTEADPVFTYGNRQALNLFEMSWAELTKTPSRLSAEPIHREERERLLAQVTQFGFVDNYSGIRISRNGRRFQVNDAYIWNLLDRDGTFCGQAAYIDEWLFL